MPIIPVNVLILVVIVSAIVFVIATVISFLVPVQR